MGEGGLRSVPVFALCLRVILGSKIVSKICLKFVNFWVQFLIFFLGGFGAPWVSLGSLLGFLRLSWEALRVRKC